jgi:hypothetical protein
MNSETPTLRVNSSSIEAARGARHPVPRVQGRRPSIIVRLLVWAVALACGFAAVSIATFALEPYHLEAIPICCFLAYVAATLRKAA